MKRSLNIEDLNYLKPSNKKGKGENYCRIIEINQTQRSNLSEGRYDLYTPIFRCKCGYVDEELGKAMHQSGFYSTGRNSSTFYSINLLDSWHFLKRSSPGTSLQALVSALELFGASRGRSSHMCGVSTLKAAKNKPVSFRSLDETGISMASCRHGIILAALNMYQGELYSYAHYLQMNRLQNVSFICQDIICKYWPWALKISSREQKFSLRQGKPFFRSPTCQRTFLVLSDRKRKLEAAELNQLTVEHNDSVTPLTRDSNGIGSANDKTTDMEESGIQQLDDDSSTPDMGEEEKPPKFRKICDFPGFKKKTLPARLK
ncbi:uncharacterized protein [Procambarus clarkii]|uniref:uncharacterized protein isoform X1 n=2 Tax=Procambarus clarkii TaxID=6728 RepID=UPI00374474B4